MREQDDHETWLVETGDCVIEKKAADPSSLTPWERLVYCLWVADYGMRNAGDLEAATDLHGCFQGEGKVLAAELSLPLTLAAFSLSRSALQDRYFDLFEGICVELRAAS